ncbi:TIM barrel protein [Deferribacter autotrophicus]|uniref:TIM barrel protein n=1 Tax=Deferribacter autotrophicus TaxID=500465 RepID=A0A5A8F272_9BACT|nr:cobamide remodeling phosphodiesterase CbiR [Deferribacter autotrophicus]KAA0257841.1 TIM barrel protein [Deferribacter autotrophicus]
MKEIPLLATTSFIYCDTRVMNVLRLMHLFDEIELLYFESRRMFDGIDENELLLLKKLNIRYCPHLPYDRDLSRKSDYEVITDFVGNLTKLPVSFFFLHSNGKDYKNIEVLAEKCPMVLVENVKNTKIFEDLFDTKINYCLDIGHLLTVGENPFEIIKKYGEKIKYIHLHGVKNGVDHLELYHLDEKLLLYIIDFAIEKKIGISLELFGFKRLLDSLNYLLEVFEKHGYAYHRWYQKW